MKKISKKITLKAVKPAILKNCKGGSSGLLGSAPEVRVRGVSSIGSNARPLF